MERSPRLMLALLAALSGCTGTATYLIDYEVTSERTINSVPPNLHIEIDGTMTRRSPDDVIQTTKLDPAPLADLRNKIAAADFPTLAGGYGCGGCADEAVHHLAVPDGDDVRAVSAETNDAPPRLRDLIAALEQIEQAPRDWH